MTAVPSNPGLFSLGSQNDSTGWIPLDSIIDDIAFNISGTFSGTISLQVSNQTDYTKTQYSTVTTYTATQAPLGLPRDIGRYFRLIMTSYVSGTAYVGISKGRSTGNQLVDLTPQTNSNDPGSTF